MIESILPHAYCNHRKIVAKLKIENVIKIRVFKNIHLGVLKVEPGTVRHHDNHNSGLNRENRKIN